MNIAKTSHRTGVWKTASPTTHSISPTSDIEEDPTANYTFPLEPAINEASEMSHEDDLVTSTILQGKLIKDRALLRKTQEHVQQLKTALQVRLRCRHCPFKAVLWVSPRLVLHGSGTSHGTELASRALRAPLDVLPN